MNMLNIEATPTTTRVLEDTQMIDSFWSRLESLSSPRP